MKISVVDIQLMQSNVSLDGKVIKGDNANAAAAAAASTGNIST